MIHFEQHHVVVDQVRVRVISWVLDVTLDLTLLLVRVNLASILGAADYSELSGRVIIGDAMCGTFFEVFNGSINYNSGKVMMAYPIF